MSKRLFCNVCNKFFDALLSTPDVVALRQHANASKLEPHRLLRANHSPIVSSMASIQSGDGHQSYENGDMNSRCSFDGLEERRLMLVAASETLKSVDSQSNCEFEVEGNCDDSDTSSLSMYSNIYWNALYSSKACQSQDQIFEALEESIQSDDEVEHHEVDSDRMDGVTVYEVETDLSEVELDEDEINSNDLIDCSSVDDCTAEIVGEFVEEIDNFFHADIGSALSMDECENNTILQKQRIIVENFYNVLPAKFNRIGKQEVNVEVALIALDHILQMNLTEQEGDDFLEVLNKVVNVTSGDVLPLPLKSKTLKKAFLSKANALFPIAKVGLRLLPSFFGTDATSSSKRKVEVPISQKPFREIEDALAMLLLKVNPEDLIVDAKESFIAKIDGSGSRERLYTDYGSGDYPIDVQNVVHAENRIKYNGKKPLIIYVSIFIDGALMNSTHTTSATPILFTIINDKKKNSTVVGFYSEKLPVPKDVLNNILLNKKIKFKTQRELILQIALKQLNYDFYLAIFGHFQARQLETNGYDVQIGLGEGAQFHRVHIEIVQNTGDHPQIHNNTGIMTNACHVCLKEHPFDFRINNKNRDGVGLCESDQPMRDPLHQYATSKAYTNALFDSLLGNKNKEKISLEKELKTIHGRPGEIETYAVFEKLINAGACNMLRMNPPDVLHTVPHGIMEYNLGFVLQCVKLISILDSKFIRGPKILTDNVAFFPQFHSLYPVRHIHFPDIMDLCVADNAKNKGKKTNTTNLITMREFYKIVSALFQVLFSCISLRILPNTPDWCSTIGLSPPFFNPTQVVLNSLMSSLQIHFYLHANSLSETQVVSLQMLIANAHAQLQILDLMRKRLLHKANHSPVSKVVFKDLGVSEMPLMDNPKLEMLSHIPDCIRNNGCDTTIFNTELGELHMKIVRALWSTTGKQKLRVAFDILKKYRDISLLQITKLGLLNHSHIWEKRSLMENRNHRSDIKLATSNDFIFCGNRGQRLSWNRDLDTFNSDKIESLNVHDSLLQFSRKSNTTSSVHVDELIKLCTGCETIEERSTLRHMMLLPHLNVSKIGVGKKEFTIYCDPLYTSVLNNNESKLVLSPRYSFLEYSHATRDLELGSCIGLVGGIFVYSYKNAIDEDVVKVSLLMIRLTLCGAQNDKGILPLPLYKCQTHSTDKRKLEIDPIQHFHVKRPLFGIQATDRHLTSFDIKTVDTSTRFYILGTDMTKCEHRVDYDYYTQRMNFLSSNANRRNSTQFHLYSQNTYMSYEELKLVKVALNVRDRLLRKKNQASQNSSGSSSSSSSSSSTSSISSSFSRINGNSNIIKTNSTSTKNNTAQSKKKKRVSKSSSEDESFDEHSHVDFITSLLDIGDSDDDY